MPLSKAQKQKVISDLKDKISRQKAIVFGDIKGVKVGDLTRLRRQIKENGGELKVAKKTLTSLVFKENNIDIDLKKISGEIALGFGYKDEISPFKAFYNFSKENENLKILGGLMEGKPLTQEEALALAKLPGRQELLARLVGGISAPASGFVSVLQGNLRNLVYLFSQLHPGTTNSSNLTTGQAS